MPIEQLTVEDIRLLIGQNIGLPYLIPVALETLERDPWVAGDFYEGDLLKYVVSVDPTFWMEHSELRERLDLLISKIQEHWDLFNEEILPAWQKIYGG